MSGQAVARLSSEISVTAGRRGFKAELDGLNASSAAGDESLRPMRIRATDCKNQYRERKRIRT